MMILAQIIWGVIQILCLLTIFTTDSIYQKAEIQQYMKYSNDVIRRYNLWTLETNIVYTYEKPEATIVIAKLAHEL